MPKRYSKKDLEAAVAKVRKGVSLRKASVLTNVPVSTIKDHARGKYKNKTIKSGGKYALTVVEEQALCNYIQYMSDRGFPLTRKIIQKLANDISCESGNPSLFNTEKGPSHKWLRSFLKRHKEPSIRKPHGLEHVRSELQPEQIEGFYTVLNKTLAKLGIKDDPTRIFNLDETGFSSKLQGREKIVVLKGMKHPYQPIVSMNGHVTLQMAISADGKTIAPLLIYSKNLPRSNFTDGIPDHWSFDVTESGFINTDIFLSWFKKCFAKQCSRSRPILVIMDNHVTHLSKELIDFAQEDQIELLCLPAHSTHLLQPLDVGYYHLLKEYFTSLSVSLGYCGLKSVPRHKFPKLLHLALNKISGSCVAAAFSCIGICPFDQNKARLAYSKSGTDILVTRVSSNTYPESGKCATCGQVSAENKLVQLGLIPEELKTILVDPPIQIKKNKSKRKLLDTARVLTCVEIKKGRYGEKGEKSDECESSNFLRPEKEPDGSEVLCEVCMTGNNEMMWIGCDDCDRWVHYECVSSKQQNLIDASLKCKTKWLCNTCLHEE